MHRHVRLSARLSVRTYQRGSYWTYFGDIWYWCPLSKSVEESKILFQIGQKCRDTLQEDLSAFHCCWRRTFAVKRCCAALSIFMLLTVTLTQQYTDNALLRFRCNNGYTNAPKCYVTRSLSVLLNIIDMRFELRSAAVWLIFIILRILNHLTHWGRVTQICVFSLQLRKTDDANLRF